MNLKDACDEALSELGQMGGEGGLIAIDLNGNIAYPFNTSGMYRAWMKQGGEINIEFY